MINSELIKKSKEICIRNKWIIVTGIAILCLIFMHFYRLADIPYGLNVDEASGAYDAINIMRYGVDRYLNSYPVYFTNYGDGQNALYIYATAVLFKLFGISKWTIRATAAIGAFLMAYFGYVYMKADMPSRQAKVIWLCLYTALPVFTMTQRFGLESHLMLPLAMISLFFVAKALETEKWKYYIASGFALGITLYTYALSYIVIPLFLILIILYSFRIKKLRWKKLLVAGAISAMFAIPLILVQVVNYFDMPQMQIGPFTIPKLLNYRIEEVKAHSVVENLKGIFRSSLLYDDLRYNTLPKYGTLFYISIPFVLIGLVKSLYEGVISWKEKKFSYAVPVICWFAGECIMGLTLSGHSVPNSTRMIGIYGGLLYFLVKGLYLAGDTLRNRKVKLCYAGTVAFCYTALFVSFASYYFTDYNADVYPLKWLFYETYDEVGEYLEENADQPWNKRTMCYQWNYIYYCLEYEINPYEMNLPQNGYERFGKDEINEYRSNIQVDANYVVYRSGTGDDYLEDYGYIPCFTGEKFRIYLSPIENYTEETEECNTLTIDSFDIQDEQIILSGWCINEYEKNCYSEIIVKIDDKEYNAEIMERPDVAKHFDNNEYINSGFSCLFPQDVFLESDKVQLVGIQSDGTQTNIISWNRKAGSVLKTEG